MMSRLFFGEKEKTEGKIREIPEFENHRL